MFRDESGAVYCHCYPVFNCEPAVAEAEGPENIWLPVCQRCCDISFEAGLQVRKLQRRAEQYLAEAHAKWADPDVRAAESRLPSSF